MPVVAGDHSKTGHAALRGLGLEHDGRTALTEQPSRCKRRMEIMLDAF